MVKQKKIIKKQLNCMAENTNFNYMVKFKENVKKLMDEFEVSLMDLAMAADIPYATLKTFIYNKDATDCKGTTIIKLAKAFGVSIDELVGADTITKETADSLKLCRELSESSLYIVRWVIRHEAEMRKQLGGKETISIMRTYCQVGSLKPTEDFYLIALDSLKSEDIKAKIHVGIEIPCEHYMPHFAPSDVLLLAADRNPISEPCVVMKREQIFIVKMRIENGKPRYYSIINGSPLDGVDEMMGYVAHVIRR